MCVCVCSRMAVKGLVSLGQCWCFQRVCHPARGSPKDRPQPQHPLKAAIGFKQQLHLPPLPGSVIGFSIPESLSNSGVNSHKFLIQGDSPSRDFLTNTRELSPRSAFCAF